MEHGESTEEYGLEEPLDIDTTLRSTGEVVFVDVKFTSGQITKLRVPIMLADDERNDGAITYSKILEHVDSAYAIGGEGHLQLPHFPEGAPFSAIFYALLSNVNSVTVHPPVMEEDNGA